MHQERDGEYDRKPGGKTRVTAIWKVWEEQGVLDRTKWKNAIQADPR